MHQIAVDLDGVLANTMESCCKIVNKRHSAHFEVSSFTQWKAWETANISKDEFFRALDEAWFEWRSIPPVKKKLAEKVGRLLRFANVDIVTGRSPETVTPAKSWLKSQRIVYNAFVRTNSTIEKVTLNYDLLIDDSPELITSLTAKPYGYAILYTQPWNKEIQEMPNVMRANSWDQIPELAHRMLRVK